MSKYLKIAKLIVENDGKKTKTRTKSKISNPLGDPQVNHPIAPVAPPEPERQPPPRPNPTPPAGPAARGRTGTWTPEMQARLNNLVNSDIPDDDISDEEAMYRSGRTAQPIPPERLANPTLRLGGPDEDEYDRTTPSLIDEPYYQDEDDLDIPVTTDNLPAVMNDALAQTDQSIQINWTPIRHLPGYLISQIRKMGRIVFEPFTDTAIEDIFVVSEMAGNSAAQTKSLFRWIQKNGTKITEVEMDLSQFFGPGYKPLVQFWSANGCIFELVHEPTMGQYYVYTWPGGMKSGFGDEDGIIADEDPDISRLKRLR